MHPAQEVSQMNQCKQERDDQQDLVLLPPYGLLVPQACNDTEHRQHDTDHVESCLAFAMRLHWLQFTVLHAVMHIDIQSDQHPQYQTNPSVCRQEYHHHQTSDDTRNGHERHPRGLERTGCVGHGLTDDQHARSYQGEGEQRTDTTHLTSHTGGYKSRQQTH